MAGFDEGVAAYEREDYETALHEFRFSAEQGLAEAQHTLGFMYAEGWGAPQNYAEAAKWYRQAAEQGYAASQFNLGLMYHEGRGVSRNYAEAAKWIREAAKQGLAEAQLGLGTLFAVGRGVSQDFVSAHMWFSLAASRMSPGEIRNQAINNRGIAESKMTSAQIAEAQRLVQAWLSTSDIAQLQGWLHRLGYDAGPQDGVVGPKTRAAVRKYERDRGLSETGNATPGLARLLLDDVKNATDDAGG